MCSALSFVLDLLIYWFLCSFGLECCRNSAALFSFGSVRFIDYFELNWRDRGSVAVAMMDFICFWGRSLFFELIISCYG